MVEIPNMQNPVLNNALEHFGNIEGKTIVDIGSGRGATSRLTVQH